MDVVVTRTFDAPVERVWQAWTEPEHVMRWWGPTGFTAPIAEMDVREGGTSLVCMRSPDGHDLYNTWTYQRVAPDERLEFLMGFAEADATPTTPAALGLPPDIPSSVPHVVTFQPAGAGKTELTVRESGYSSQQTVDFSRLGLEQVLDKLAASLSSAEQGNAP